ncbi:Mor transcription activator family protein [Pseudomonas sp. AU11447]|uniref:Mor transcription activator family protein n=1 Tax=Pseudomonas sp. AU11447 TaxID=1843184 RepID=UPI001586D187|nr:Mor transcription activator family protein [Pseudomonas sp. AU11447]
MAQQEVPTEHNRQHLAEQFRHLLPDSVQELADFFGLENALHIVTCFSGTSLRIPKKTQGSAADELFKKLDNQDLAEKLINTFGDNSIYFSKCDKFFRAIRDTEIHKAAEIGLSEGKTMRSVVDSLSRRYDLCDRVIWKIMKSPPHQKIKANQYEKH